MTYRILVTDDNSDYRQTILEFLEFEGFALLEAADGQTALELAKSRQPDLILCDVDMPGMDGFAVLTALKTAPTTANIPFVLVTGRADVASVKRGKELGATAYLVKPLNPTELLATIRQYLPDN